MTPDCSSTCKNYEKIEEKSLCGDCVFNDICKQNFGYDPDITCPKLTLRICGNCSWGIEEYGGIGIHCQKTDLYNGAAVTPKSINRDFGGCQWQPIKPVCDVCGGAGKVCGSCGNPILICSEKCEINESYYPQPCPTCSEKGEKRLMMPVRWDDSRGNSSILFFYTKRLGEIQYRNGAWWPRLFPPELGNKLKPGYETRDQAKAAVEKAMGKEGRDEK